MTQVNETIGGQRTEGRFARFVTVTPPAAHEGVGRALRDVYIPRATLPNDLLALLDKLDEL